MRRRILLPLLLCLALGGSAAAESYVEVRRSDRLAGVTETLAVAEGPAGIHATRSRTGAPGSARVLSGTELEGLVARLTALGITELSDFTQPGIEDAPTYRFYAEIGGRTVDFTVRAVLADLADPRYRRIFEELRAAAGGTR